VFIIHRFYRIAHDFSSTPRVQKNTFSQRTSAPE